MLGPWKGQALEKTWWAGLGPSSFQGFFSDPRLFSPHAGPSGHGSKDWPGLGERVEAHLSAGEGGWGREPVPQKKQNFPCTWGAAKDLGARTAGLWGAPARPWLLSLDHERWQRGGLGHPEGRGPALWQGRPWPHTSTKVNTQQGLSKPQTT